VKHFFYVLIGGILAVACGIILAISGRYAIRTIAPHLAKFKIPALPSISLSMPHFSFTSFSNLASAIISQPTDGTSISGLKRLILYTASEEEDLMTAATLSLPKTGSSIRGVSATAYIVKDLTSGEIVAESNSDKLLPIASLTKLVTAVVAKKLINSESRIVITKEIMNTYGNTGQFKVGETIKAFDLYYPLLMVSSNDAAEAFARSYGRARFLTAMNDFVQSIGAYRTTFADPSGLSADNRSTAKDMVIILDWVRVNQPEIIAITEMKTKTVRAHTWVNPTHFLSWSNYLGGKNGYTDEANRTAAALFQMGKNKDVHAIIVLGSSVRDDDIIKLLGKVEE
jgi:D-alanyl-D-alanine carboxypeptidase